MKCSQLIIKLKELNGEDDLDVNLENDRGDVLSDIADVIPTEDKDGDDVILIY
jgi:hypothetical protein